MPLQRLEFRPGINSDLPRYANEYGWINGDKIRFRFGFPEKIGGWTRAIREEFIGSCRSLHAWTTLNLERYIGIGTHLKYLVNYGGTLYDITPIREASNAGEVTFAAVPDSAEITVTHFSHRARVGDFVTFTDADGLGGEITADVLNQEYQIDRVLDGNRYTIIARLADSGLMTYASGGVLDFTGYTIAADSSDTGDGGTATVGTYQVNTGLDITVYGDGWGAGSFGGEVYDVLATQLSADIDDSTTTIPVLSTAGFSAGDMIRIDSELILIGAIGTGEFTGCTRAYESTAAAAHDEFDNVALANTFVGWGEPADIKILSETLRLWQQDTYGEDLLLNIRGGPLYYWDAAGVEDRAVTLGERPGAQDAPVAVNQVMVSDVDRHVLAFGVNPLGSETLDPLLIRFSDQNNPADWRPSTTNTAGDLRLGTGTEIIQAVETRQQILIFTDSSLHNMQFIGPPFIFGINLISDNVTLMSPNSAIAVEDNVYWMGQGGFYMYGGTVKQLACTIQEHVFDDLNYEQIEKITSGVNSTYSEVWWFYPSADSEDLNRYAIYNYEQDIWYYGTLSRTAWLDRGASKYPIATTNEGVMYYHEASLNDESVVPPVPIESYIESAPIDLGDGDRLSYVRRMVPDVSFRGSTASDAQVDIELSAYNYSGGDYTAAKTAGVVRTAKVPVQTHTQKNDLRLRGRALGVKVSSNKLDTTWRLGVPRLDIKPDGGR